MKTISGGQSGGDLAGNLFAKKHGIGTEINTFEGFKPAYDELPKDIKINYVCNDGNYSSNLKCRTLYNVENSKLTIILLNKPIEKTKGSKLTLNYALKLHKPCIYINIYNNRGGYTSMMKSIITLDDVMVILQLRRVIYQDANDIINIAGQRDLNINDAIKFLEKLLC